MLIIFPLMLTGIVNITWNNLSEKYQKGRRRRFSSFFMRMIYSRVRVYITITFTCPLILLWNHGNHRRIERAPGRPRSSWARKRKLQIKKLIRRMETPDQWPYRWISNDFIQFYSIFNVLRDDVILSHPDLHWFQWTVIRHWYPYPEMKYFSWFPNKWVKENGVFMRTGFITDVYFPR